MYQRATAVSSAMSWLNPNGDPASSSASSSLLIRKSVSLSWGTIGRVLGFYGSDTSFAAVTSGKAPSVARVVGICIPIGSYSPKSLSGGRDNESNKQKQLFVL